MNNSVKQLLYILSTILGITLAMVLTGCVTEKRCMKKFPPHTETITVVKDTTIYIEKTSTDTILDLREVEVHDTITIDGTGTRDPIIRYVKLPGDSVWVEAECPEDSTEVTVSETTINNTTYTKETKGNFWTPFLLGVIATLLAQFAFKTVLNKLSL